MYQFAYDCQVPESDEELDFIQQHFIEMDICSFKKAVGEGAFKQVVESLNTYSEDFPIEDDRYVEYRMSKTPENEIIYYFVHSAIEYVFKKNKLQGRTIYE